MLPEEFHVSEARNKVGDNKPTWLEANRKFSGTGGEDLDHWQEGDGVLGDLKPSAASSTYNERLEKLFIVEDVISDVVGRRTDGVLGHDPSWSLVQEDAMADGEDAEEDPREAALRQWWSDKAVIKTLREFATGLTAEERTYLRLYVSQSASGGDQEDETDGGVSPDLPGVTDPMDALEYIHVEQVGRDHATVHVDPPTKQETGIVVFKDDGDDLGESDYVEITWVDNDGITHLRTLGNTGAEDAEGSQLDQWSANLRGHMFIHEGEVPLLISQSVRRNQRDLNTKRTQLSISDTKNAFRSWFGIDVEQPTDKDGNPKKPDLGPGSWAYYLSVPKQVAGEQGSEERSPSPSIYESDPPDNENMRKNCDVARMAIYRNAKQLHVTMGADATASGESRKQARADYENDLKGLATEINRAGTWMIEAVWALAERMAGREVSEDLSAQFQAHADSGPLTQEEKKEVREEVKDRLLSRRTAMGMLGIEDPEAEIQQIQKEQEEMMTPQEQTRLEADRLMLGQQNGAAERRQEIEQAAEEG